MITCDYCRDRLLDHVYGLLEGIELEQTRDHLNTCFDCQTALAKVQTQQKLMARAAKAVTEVAEFALPAERPAEAVPTVPITLDPMVRRSIWARPALYWAAAAVVVFAISASVSYYRYTVHGHQDVLAEKRKEHKKIADEFAALPVKYQLIHHAAVAEAHRGVGPYLHVVGPTTFQPGAKAHLYVTSHHVEGTFRQTKSESDRSNLRVKLVDAQSGKSVQVSHLKVDDDGHAFPELDATDAKPGSTLNVIVEANIGTGRAHVQGTMQVLAPTYVARIDTNKIAYQLKDVLFFRAVVLDRYTLQPPSDAVALRIELRHTPTKKIVQTFDLPTGDGGIVARDIAIDPAFMVGSYTLNVESAEPNKFELKSASQKIEVVRELRLPDIQFDRDDYLPGQVVSGRFQGPSAKAPTATINNVPVPLTVHREQLAAPMPIPRAMAGAGGGFGAKGGPNDKNAKDGKKIGADANPGVYANMAKAATLLYRFEAKIPEKLPAGANRVPLLLEFPNGKTPSQLRASLPMAPTEFRIDFFPEGGDLIAGLPNRVFYRVRSKSGEPITGAGRVWILTGKDGIPQADSSYELGMGYLDFVPDPKETYTVCISTPAKIETIASPFAKRGMRNEGVVIQVADLGEERAPKAVGSQGDPIRLTLRQQGPARKLLLIAHCRGQVVDQRIVDVKREAVDVTLLPTQEATGMIRVTAYELHDKTLQPIAERLVYRAAAQRLDLGFSLNTQQITPGPVVGKITARDEKGHPAPAWILASVVDERLQNLPRSLSAHFFLLNEIRTGPDLDNAQLILHDSAESAQVLERFLGTHGWRRFVRSEETAVGNAKKPLEPVIFIRENMPLDVIQEQYKDKLEQALDPIRKKGFTEVIEIESQRDRAVDAVMVALSNLNAFENRVQSGFRLALGMLVAVLLATALILMGVATYRLVRAHKIATPAFGGSFACLAGCLGIIFVGAMLGPISVTQPPPLATAHGNPAWKINGDMKAGFERMPALAFVPTRPKTNDLALPRLAEAEKKRAIDFAAEKASGAADELAMMARRDRGASFVADRLQETQNLLNGTPAWNALNKRKMEAPVPPPAGGGPEKADALRKNEEAKKLAQQADMQFAHQYAPELLSDTLLWRPTLWLEGGDIEVHFGIASGNATYRVLLLGHNRSGRFGFYETRLDVLGR